MSAMRAAARIRSAANDCGRSCDRDARPGTRAWTIDRVQADNRGGSACLGMRWSRSFVIGLNQRMEDAANCP